MGCHVNIIRNYARQSRMRHSYHAIKVIEYKVVDFNLTYCLMVCLVEDICSTHCDLVNQDEDIPCHAHLGKEANCAHMDSKFQFLYLLLSFPIDLPAKSVSTTTYELHFVPISHIALLEMYFDEYHH